MAKGKSKVTEIEEMKVTLGLPFELSCFPDGKVRKVNPITMRHFPRLVESLSLINIRDFWVNFAFEESTEAVNEVVKMSFEEEDFEELIDNINAGNFNEIMETIVEINGLGLALEDKEGKNEKEV